MPAAHVSSDTQAAWRRDLAGDSGTPLASDLTPQPLGVERGAARSPERRAAPRTETKTPAVALLLAKVAASSRLWGWSRIVRGSRPLRPVPGLQWARVMGSGHGGGFGLRPSASHQGVLAVFDSQAAAQAFLHGSDLVAEYRRRSDECLTALLQPWSVRGRWGGQGIALPATLADQSTVTLSASSSASSSAGSAPASPAGEPPAGPVLALTRASIRPRKAAPFWAMAPAAQASLLTAPGCRLAAGLGEAPLLRQCTVSLWDSVAAMDAYARSGAHLAAIRAAAAGGFFSESMFARFRVLAIEGRWQGQLHG